MQIRDSHYSPDLNYCLVRLSRAESQTEVMNVHRKSRKDAAEATYERADLKQWLRKLVQGISAAVLQPRLSGRGLNSESFTHDRRWARGYHSSSLCRIHEQGWATTTVCGFNASAGLCKSRAFILQMYTWQTGWKHFAEHIGLKYNWISHIHKLNNRGVNDTKIIADDLNLRWKVSQI